MRAQATLAMLVLVGCKPQFEARPSLVTGPEVLAISGEPAESSADQQVTYRILVASPEGTDPAPPAEWAFCTAPKPLTQNNVVDDSCVTDDSAPIGGPAPVVSAFTPPDACSLFGPEAPPATSGSPGRPTDPDVTGGYYQPVRAQVRGLTAFGLERITCDLANAPVDVAIAFRAQYTPNQNPALTPLTVATEAGVPVGLGSIPAGQKLLLQVGWTPESPETYPVFDPATQSLVQHRESMRVSWFATAGAFDNDRTGRAEGDMALTTSNTWTAPDVAGPVHFWVVLRDARGGMDFASYDGAVVP